MKLSWVVLPGPDARLGELRRRAKLLADAFLSVATRGSWPSPRCWPRPRRKVAQLGVPLSPDAVSNAESLASSVVSLIRSEKVTGIPSSPTLRCPGHSRPPQGGSSSSPWSAG
ncbi:MAG: hypothetical protein AB1Z98_40030 [Nannocystaceae bacterium]